MGTFFDAYRKIRCVYTVDVIQREGGEREGRERERGGGGGAERERGREGGREGGRDRLSTIATELIHNQMYIHCDVILTYTVEVQNQFTKSFSGHCFNQCSIDKQT